MVEVSELSFWLIVGGSFLASFVSASVGLGGAFILLALTSSILPLSTVIPVHSSLLIGGLISRILAFRQHIHWHIVLPFSLGCVFGVFVGAMIYVDLPEWFIALVLSMIMFSVWLPGLRVPVNLPRPFFWIGIIHSFFSTVFSFGGLLHASLIRTSLSKVQIVATGSCSLLAIGLMKIVGYSAAGFSYTPFLSLILWATLVSIIGTWLGKQFIHLISERVFRLALKTVMTIMGLKLLYQGILLWY